MEKDGFTEMIDVSNAFFTELERNNTKDWFNPRKDHYNANIKKPAELFGSLLAEDISRITGKTYAPKLFRIYRDVRFSKDKTPLKPYLHMLWTPKGGHPFAPSFFFGSDPKRLDVACGIMDMKGEALRKFRAMIDKDGDELEDVICKTGMAMSDWGPEPLKRVPAPFDKDHPHGEMLKRKAFLLSRGLGQDWRTEKGGLIGAVNDAVKATNPLVRFLDTHLG